MLAFVFLVCYCDLNNILRSIIFIQRQRDNKRSVIPRNFIFLFYIKDDVLDKRKLEYSSSALRSHQNVTNRNKVIGNGGICPLFNILLKNTA